MTWEEISKELFEKRTAKRFKLRLSKLGNGMITDTQKRENLYFDKEFLDATIPKANEWLNELADENEQLKQSNTYLQGQLEDYSSVEIDNVELREENEQLKQQITELYNMIKIDIDNGIEVYPKKLGEYIANILKIIGDVE